MPYPSIDRPRSLGGEHWKSIRHAQTRMEGAIERQDWALAVGCAKELCEAVARCAIETLGQTPASGTSYSEVVSTSQRLVGRHPGPGLAHDPHTRDLSQAASKIVTKLGQLRNEYGTGHGRAYVPEVLAEHAELCCDASILWTRWILRRLDGIVAGRAAQLVDDLSTGAIFYKGGLARRLTELDLPSLDESEQRRLGIAVGQRAAGGTVNVYNDGVRDAIGSRQAPWTRAYMTGLTEGLLLNREGRAEPYLDGMLAIVSSPLGPRAADLRGIVDRVAQAGFAHQLGTSRRHEACLRLRAVAADYPQPVADQLLQLADVFDPALG